MTKISDEIPRFAAFLSGDVPDESAQLIADFTAKLRFNPGYAAQAWQWFRVLLPESYEADAELSEQANAEAGASMPEKWEDKIRAAELLALSALGAAVGDVKVRNPWFNKVRNPGFGRVAALNQVPATGLGRVAGIAAGIALVLVAPLYVWRMTERPPAPWGGGGGWPSMNAELVQLKIEGQLRDSYMERLAPAISYAKEEPKEKLKEESLGGYVDGSELIFHHAMRNTRRELSQLARTDVRHSLDAAVAALAAQVVQRLPSGGLVQFDNAMVLPSAGEAGQEGRRIAFYQVESAIRQLQWLVPATGETASLGGKLGPIPATRLAITLEQGAGQPLGSTLKARMRGAAGDLADLGQVRFSSAAPPLPLRPHFGQLRVDKGQAALAEAVDGDAAAVSDSFVLRFPTGADSKCTLIKVDEGDEDPHLDPDAVGAELCLEIRAENPDRPLRVILGIGGDSALVQSTTPPLQITGQWQRVSIPAKKILTPGGPWKNGLTVHRRETSEGEGGVVVRHAFLRQILKSEAAE